MANGLSRTASNLFRSEQALKRFNSVFSRVDSESSYIDSLRPSVEFTKATRVSFVETYNKQIRLLTISLLDLKGELRTAKILTTLARIEASQADAQYQASLESVATNVEEAASGIRSLIEASLIIVSDLIQE